ncbi:MAG: chemotaxis protein CheA [Proteobacteria bacterium]|nr:chemotaxis protein CheA [Pseudomonadota bacterium]
MTITNTYSETYKEETNEQLLELEESLLELEETPDDGELIGKVFRIMHTIKGSGAMFGFDDIAAFTHDIETVYDKVRAKEIPVTKELINLTLLAKDRIKSMLDKTPLDEALEGLTPSEIVTAFKMFASGGEALPPLFNLTPPVEGASFHQINCESATYRIRFKPSTDVFFTGTNLLLLLDDLRSLGECKVVAQIDNIPPLDEINPEYCYTSWDMILTTDQGINTIKDVFIFIEDSCELTINIIDCKSINEDEEDYKKIGEILVEKGDLRKEDLQEVLNQKKYLGEILVEKGLVVPDKVASALVEQEHVRRMRDKSKAKEDAQTSIRVPAEKLDTLVNLVGELVTVQAHLTQTTSFFHNAELNAIAEEVERLTVELRDNTLNIRMLPIGTTFGRFKRLVRDLSVELGKEIELVTEGAETELDKTVIERLNDPLIHLIRNSIDHGIEPPDVRVSKGKPKAGTILLSAIHSGGNVIIRIQDDGKGLDKEAILAKAEGKGLVAQNADLTEKDIFGFIFHPGFSTAREVTSVSGRGVGMDVVQKAIDSLRGLISITSVKDKGTTVTLTLPLTLAIIEGLLVAIGRSNFVIPLSIVEECVELTGEDVKKSYGRNIARIRGELVPYIRLRNEFNIRGERPPIEQIVVTGRNGERMGFVVDQVIGEHQTVIKNLGKFYRNVEGISGATILGDGTVALILDATKIAKNVEMAEAVFG